VSITIAHGAEKRRFIDGCCTDDRLNVPGDRKPVMYARGISTLDQLIERVDAWKQGGSPVEYYILGDGAGTEPMAGMIHIAGPEWPDTSTWGVHVIAIDNKIVKVLEY
jgi:hypothetical protein